MYFVINGILHALHLIIILASLGLFLFPSMIIYHLILQFLIFLSWFVLGPLVGEMGFCLVTGAQKKWNQLNGKSFKNSYIVYLLEKFGFKNLNTERVNIFTITVFFMCTIASILFFILDK